MGKCRNATKVGGSGHKDASPNPSSHGGGLCDTVQDLIEEVASQTGASPKTPFRFTVNRLLSVCSPLLEHQQAHSTTPNDWIHYCIHITVTLGEGKGDKPPPSHAWSGSLITNI